jgi:iron complex outermembrane receptor protein
VNAPVVYGGDILGSGGASPSLEEVGRNVANVFGEIVVPLHKTVEANLAVRTDHYSDFGTTTNPKVVLRWQPSRAVMLRGAWGTGFRAPTLSNLFMPLETSFVGPYDDPLRCAATGLPIDCEADFQGRFGGNAALKPERSRQLNFGVIVEPVAGLSVALDYYDVEIRDVITMVPASAIFSDYARWGPQLVVRRPPTAANPGLPGPIDYVLMWNINAGDMHTSGYDVDARYRTRLAGGMLAVGLVGTYVRDYQVKEFEPVVSGPGTGRTGAIPRWRHYASIDWNSGAWGATLAQNFQHGYDEVDLRTCPSNTPSSDCTGKRRVGSLEVYDLQARYGGWRNVSLSLGVRNVFDRAPPRAFAPMTFQIGYDASYADIRGRSWYGSLRYTFK